MYFQIKLQSTLELASCCAENGTANGNLLSPNVIKPTKTLIS